jgi:hypothetical protein
MAQPRSNKVRRRFSLRSLLAAVTACAVLSRYLRPVIAWLFPPEPNWDELMRLIQSTVEVSNSWSESRDENDSVGQGGAEPSN